jgi:cystathionine beta-lyase/cystathionine gamma-synthase
MQDNKINNYLKEVLKNMPEGWLSTTTHRLDIYNEKLAKVEFLEKFENLYSINNASKSALSNLPTAYDYIRLGHPLSCVLEWAIAKKYNFKPEQVISFSSKTIPVLSILRKNLLENINTQILYTGNIPGIFNSNILKNVYGYHYELKQINTLDDVTPFEGRTVFVSEKNDIYNFDLLNTTLNDKIDFYVNLHQNIGSILLVNGSKNDHYISEIQHVRRRETIAMTPANCLTVLKELINEPVVSEKIDIEGNKTKVIKSVNYITNTTSKVLVSSSGLSIQYAILMGLIDYAQEQYPNKDIKIVVPPNCYGGTNDQARRVAKCLKNVEVMDLPVDGDHDMVQSIDTVLDEIANLGAVPLIIAEIPTNPRVEVPNLVNLRDALSKKRQTPTGETAIDPVFILDQTFCPNVRFLGENDILSTVRTISFASGSKFPSGGKCTAGYCVGNEKTKYLIDKIELHLNLCDNEATDLQMEILANQLPSMLERISGAYKNTRDFVNFIKETLPTAKINFVSEELAKDGFTPSVFSLDLPTKGKTDEEREAYKRTLNLKLIDLMINEIPTESKYCVSYGQLKGCYWTIPATSTQGTTKEGDKDYIARVALSPDMDLDKHKAVFKNFVKSI